MEAFRGAEGAADDVVRWPGLGLELVHEGGDVGDLLASLLGGGLLVADDLDLQGGVDAEGRQLDLVEGLLLGLHDAGQRGVAGLVQAQVGGDDAGQAALDRLEAAVGFAHDGGVAAIDGDAVGKRALTPAEELGEHLGGLVVVVVDGLLAHQHHVGCFLLDDLLQDLGDAVGVEFAVVLDEDGAVGAHGEGGAELGDAVVAADGEHDDLAAMLLFLAQGLFNGDLVEGVHDHVDAVSHDPALVGLELDLGFVVRHALDGHQELHRRTPSTRFDLHRPTASSPIGQGPAPSE